MIISWKSNLFNDQIKYLQVSNKVNVTLRSQLVPDPLLEDLGKALVNLEPGRIEAQAERGSVGTVMPGRDSK